MNRLLNAFFFSLLGLAPCNSACSLRRPIEVPPPSDFITVHVRPVIVWKDGIGACSPMHALKMFSTIDREYQPMKLRFDVRTPVRWDNADVFDVDSEADWRAIIAESKRIADQEKEFAIVFVNSLSHFGERVVGITMYPPNHGCAIVGWYDKTWVTGHEAGHYYGLKHAEPVRDPKHKCRLMSYNQSTIPPCDEVFLPEEAAIAWQWMGVYPRLNVETHPDRVRLSKQIVTGPEEFVVCTPE